MHESSLIMKLRSSYIFETTGESAEYYLDKLRC